MSEFLDEQYLNWLYSQVGSVKSRNKARNHWNLLRQMYRTEFIWLIPNDDNRVADGKDLRYEFLAECGVDEVDPDWLDLGCSFLEMLIGLSRRLSFETEGEPRIWFWHLIETLDLEQYNDAYYDKMAERKIDAAMNNVIWRTYSPSGKGGLFPLNHPDRDQREVEIWYQLSAYLMEQGI